MLRKDKRCPPQTFFSKYGDKKINFIIGNYKSTINEIYIMRKTLE
jgi:hypothetical protein